jgi:hypothetical protein
VESKDNLSAKVEIIRNNSFLESIRYLKIFVEYERKNSIDVVVAELPEGDTVRLQKVMAGPEECYHFSKTGHLSILFHYMQITRKISTHYTNIQKLPKVLKKVKKQMKAKNQNNLYQICMKENQETVKQYLADEGFKIK